MAAILVIITAISRVVDMILDPTFGWCSTSLALRAELQFSTFQHLESVSLVQYFENSDSRKYFRESEMSSVCR